MFKIIVCCLFLVSCSHALPPDFKISQLKTTFAVQHYNADAEVCYKGPEGRATLKASMAVKKPEALRFDIYGPQGTVIISFATDGKLLRYFDLNTNEQLRDKATTENIDKLLWFAPLHKTPQEWVALLFGEFTWDETLQIDTKKSQLFNATTRIFLNHDLSAQKIQFLQNQKLISEVEYSKRNAEGLPTQLYIYLPPEKIRLKIKLKEIDTSIPISPEAFH